VQILFVMEREHWVATHYRRGEVTRTVTESQIHSKPAGAVGTHLWSSSQEWRPLLYQFSSRKAAQTVASSVLHAGVGDCLEMVFDQGMMGSHLFHCFESQKLTAFLQLSAPARHGKTSIGIINFIVFVGCQSILINTWCSASCASHGFTLGTCGPDNWACTQCELRS